MTQRRAFLAGFSGIAITSAQAAPPRADDGAEKGACPRCGRVHDLIEPLKQTGKP